MRADRAAHVCWLWRALVVVVVGLSVVGAAGQEDRQGATSSQSVEKPASALDPNDAVIGISLGNWNAATSGCQVLLANDAAAVGSSFVGSATLAGTFCIRIIDVGRLTGPVSYSVSVSHT